MGQVSVHIPPMLREYCDVGPEISARGLTVAEVLMDIKSAWPNVYRSICDETGQIRPHINLFLNAEMINCRDGEELHEAISSSDTLTILTAVSGG